MAYLWKRLFKGKDHLSDALEKAVEAQAAWEAKLDAKYAPDQRAIALTQRFKILFGADPPQEALDLIRKAADEWDVVTKAAKETR